MVIMPRFSWSEREKDERKQDSSDAATGVNYNVASFSSWSKSICNSETGISKIRATSKDYCLLKGDHLEWLWTSRQAPISPKGKPLG